MDQAMHQLWLRAERRIDLAIAGMAACGLWALLLPAIVILTGVHWTSQYSVALIAGFPVALVLCGPLRSGLRVARAIEERDLDEVERWRETRLPPASPDLLMARMRRVHFPLLGVVAGFAAVIGMLGYYGMTHPDYSAMRIYALGIMLTALGVALCALILMTVARLSSRVVLALLTTVSWLVPAGIGTGAWALIAGRVQIADSAGGTSTTAIVYVIFGVILFLIAISLSGLWAVWLGRALRGLGLELNLDARTVPAITDESVLAFSDPEFDETDVRIVREALAVSLRDRAAGVLVALASVGILLLGAVGQSGTPIHGVVGGILVVALVYYIARMRGPAGG